MNTPIDLPDDDSDTDGDIPIMGVPDMLIQVQSSNLVPTPLWVFEVSQSQTTEAALWKLKCFAQKSLNLEALTLIDIAENSQYHHPKELWAIGNGLDASEKTVSGFEEWVDEVLVEDSGKVSMFSHTWMHPFKVTIMTWIHSPDNILDIDNHDANCYASEVLFPQLAGLNTSLAGNQRLFQCALGAIHDKAVERLEKKYVGTDPLVESIQSIRDWLPPAAPIDWDDSASDLKDAAIWFSYKRYCAWYRKFLKRVSDEDCSGGRTTGRAGRSA